LVLADALLMLFRPTAEKYNGLSNAQILAADRVRKSIHKRRRGNLLFLFQPARWNELRLLCVGGLVDDFISML
jgi:hypothetical protein